MKHDYSATTNDDIISNKAHTDDNENANTFDDKDDDDENDKGNLNDKIRTFLISMIGIPISVIITINKIL